jgi:hypothetical protein
MLCRLYCFMLIVVEISVECLTFPMSCKTILRHTHCRLMGVISSNLDEDLSETARLLSGKHIQERLGCALQTVVLALLELQVTECKLLGDGGVEVIDVFGLRR